jgi:hypothetical protein
MDSFIKFPCSLVMKSILTGALHAGAEKGRGKYKYKKPAPTEVEAGQHFS